jgi:hypothetical protein
MIEGCVVKRATDYYLVPTNGSAQVKLDANNMQPFNRLQEGEHAQVFGHAPNGTSASGAYNAATSAKQEGNEAASNGSMNPASTTTTASSTATTPSSVTGTQQTAGVSGAATQGAATTGASTANTSAIGSATSTPGAQPGVSSATSTGGAQEFVVDRVTKVSETCSPAGGSQTPQ